MGIALNNGPVKLYVPHGTAREALNLGGADDPGKINGECFRFCAGADITPLLAGLTAEECLRPHWGYILAGEFVVGHRDGAIETLECNHLFYLPPGHTLRAWQDSQLFLFQPPHQDRPMLEQIAAKLAAALAR